MKNLSGITKIVKNDEWYTTKETVNLMFDLLGIPNAAKVICPFDIDKSNFVLEGIARSYEMLYGMRDWLTGDYQYDYLITNLPYSIKDDVIEKCLISGKPSALVLPIDSMGGKRRHGLYKKYGYPTIYMPTKRINYISVDGLHTKGNHFHSIIMILNDPKGNRLIWE